MASSSAFRYARFAVPAASATFLSSWKFVTQCDSDYNDIRNPQQQEPTSQASFSSYYGMKFDEPGDFHGLFPKRQLWQPKVEYPLWDPNWDGRSPSSTGDVEEDRRKLRKIRKEGVTRHIILVRHGQYDERLKEDAQRKLTELGKLQAEYTGRRLREMIQGVQGTTDFTPCNIKIVRVSNMARAKETASIIMSQLPNSVQLAEPDPDLNEGRPAHNIPGGKASASTVEKFDEQHPRIERAFQKYFYRADEPKEEDEEDDDGDKNDSEQSKHEFEIIVCHANVIRYFLCRALQLPPEAWLRLCTFNCSLTYLTIRPTGTVSCRMLGDIGHLPYGLSSFSGHHGYNW
ncbi:histidine phosphatase superfamily protein [Nitzschia inconspicua]|uniref:Serine/threonine-protein phosphatase PGAM5, mitochondrial n=1 Tax=Nitzschia inconspicua TaxID=303405 RepID=A0A9K3PWC1_9STRA|nr:histidine phosphatase superfamily protein [Nitzschia inconspicua]